MSEYIGIIKDKLHMDDKEFEIIMNPPVHQHSDYKTEDETVGYKLWQSFLKTKKNSKDKL